MNVTGASPSLNLPAWDSRMSSSLKSGTKPEQEDAKLKKACQEMEAVFLNMLLKTMRETVPKSTLGGTGMQGETMQSMFDMELTRNMAAAGGTGIAAMMYRSLKNPGAVHPPNPSTPKG
jgi:flagellar protein FlgJ